MSHSVEDGWVLDEAEALLDMDGRRERLELIVAGLQNGRIQPVGHATARDRIEKHLRGRCTRWRGSGRPQLKLLDARGSALSRRPTGPAPSWPGPTARPAQVCCRGDLYVPLCLRVMVLAVTAWPVRWPGEPARAGSRSGPEPAKMLTVIGRRHLEAH